MAEVSTIPCRYCQQPVSPRASKCHHCGEQLVARSKLESITRKTMGLIGLGTALLSLFFGLKEGYFFIQERQQQRAMAASYLSAAEHFIKLDSLSYAEDSLNRALAANPNDQPLRARIFFLRAGHLLREADFYGSQLPDDKLEIIPAMIIDGFALLNNKLPADVRARLMLYLARLLQYDRQWQAGEGITDLFEQAYLLAPANAELAYWFGDWLVQEESSKQRGFALIQSAATAQPDNALYATALGQEQADQGDLRAAVYTFKRAIDSKPGQHELQNIRAANQAKQDLARALISAHEISAISGKDFFGMSLEERVSITRYALLQTNNRRLRLLAAELFHRAELDQEAETQIRKVLGNYNTRSSSEKLTLLAAILGARNKNAERQTVLQLLARKKELATFEEVLETGLTDQHRYKVGLKLAREKDAEGVLVLTAYEQYPFHKAGVRSGDRLLKFGHRDVENMRSISGLVYTFTPGTDVPLKIRRGDQLLDLSVVIE